MFTVCPNRSPRLGQGPQPLRLPGLRRASARNGRAAARPAASGTPCSRGGARRPRPRPRRQGAAAGAWNSSGWRAAAPPPPRVPTGIAGTGPRAGRRAGPGLRGAGRRRSGDRQVHPAAAGRRPPGRAGRRVLYISGEESIEQVRLRARRLGVHEAPLELAAAINLRDIAASLQQAGDAALVVIDSIQTMWLDAIDSAPGTVAQVRACQLRADPARQGARTSPWCWSATSPRTARIAGPRVLEHMVDAVLYFEGDRGHQFRILRAVKNRFGATDEIGVFEMTERGPGRGRQPLGPVPGRAPRQCRRQRGVRRAGGHAAGAGGGAGAAVAQSPAARPRRSVVGWDSGRLPMLLAVLEARGGLRLERERRLPQHRRRPAHQRAGRRPRGGRRAGLGRDRPADRSRAWSISARSACRARSARSRRPSRG